MNEVHSQFTSNLSLELSILLDDVVNHAVEWQLATHLRKWPTMTKACPLAFVFGSGTLSIEACFCLKQFILRCPALLSAQIHLFIVLYRQFWHFHKHFAHIGSPDIVSSHSLGPPFLLWPILFPFWPRRHLPGRASTKPSHSVVVD